jgi:hypothetical protein
MRRNRIFPILFTFCICFCGACQMTSGKQVLTLLPDAPQGWQIEGESRSYSSDNLYEYINGGAELYISFGFKNVGSRIYTGVKQPDILLDIFDMGSSQSAFGIFSHSRERLEQDYGQGSQMSPGLLIFWKGRYYVSILATPETPESRKAVDWIARRIEQSITETGSLPEILRVLPEEGLISESIRTFTHHAWINTYYFIAEENLLNINPQNTAVLAKYQVKDEKLLLLLVEYTDEIDALNACDTFIQGFLPEAEQEAAQIEDKTWVAIRSVDNYVVVVFQGITVASAVELLDQFEEKVNEINPYEGGNE